MPRSLSEAESAAAREASASAALRAQLGDAQARIAALEQSAAATAEAKAAQDKRMALLQAELVAAELAAAQAATEHEEALASMSASQDALRVELTLAQAASAQSAADATAERAAREDTEARLQALRQQLDGLVTHNTQAQVAAEVQLAQLKTSFKALKQKQAAKKLGLGAAGPSPNGSGNGNGNGGLVQDTSSPGPLPSQAYMDDIRGSGSVEEHGAVANEGAGSVAKPEGE